MKAFFVAALAAVATGCTTVPPMGDYGYYTPGRCTGGVCSLPRSVPGYFPAAPPIPANQPSFEEQMRTQDRWMCEGKDSPLATCHYYYRNGGRRK